MIPVPLRIGGDGRSEAGVEFPSCARWWTRGRGEFPGRAPAGVGSRRLVDYVWEAREFLRTGALGRADDLPGRLRDCMAILSTQEALRDARRAKIAEEQARRMQRGR